MRTKKVLSILLAAIMTLGIGMVGVFAEDADELVTAEAQATAMVGWPTDVELTPRPDLAGSWDAAVITWETFSATTDAQNKSNKDSYLEKKNATPSKASVEWSVWIYPKTGEEKMTVYKTSTQAAGKPFVCYELTNGTQEQLNIKQGTGKYYSQVKVVLKVTATDANGIPQSVTSDPIYVNLVDQTSFNKKLAEAKKILDKSSRYTEDYISLLSEVYSAAEVYRAVMPSQRTIDLVIADLDEVIKDAPNHYYLLGWEGFDKIFAGPIYWIMDVGEKVSEVFGKLSEVFGPMTKFFTQLFNSFGFLIPLFVSLFGLLGL